MFDKIFKRKTKEEQASPDTAVKPSWFSRLKSGLSKTRSSLSNAIADLCLGKKTIDDSLYDALEQQLLMSDFGVETTDYILKRLTESASRQSLSDGATLFVLLKQILVDILTPSQASIDFNTMDKKPYVMLVVGANGNGKTTTIGKLAYQLQTQGKKVMLAAGDTFRAAAVEQLKVWGERAQVPVTAQHTGADSAAVIYDAVESATAKGFDVVIADTAGRLHTRSDLMQELEKISRVLKKLDNAAPHEILLVLDAGTGQNALSQVTQFKELIKVSGLALTKLDGTAKGGISFALAQQCGLPIRYIGVGEGIEDLRQFEAKEFVDALFDGINEPT